ncbi:Xaa-Pro aminopeptidase [Agaribacter flavus]|uniref:Xaa-Pro aminopeptidase n=1 Tax=Agaribacter flavus TaxID=1902781 RepID=A0ABV7FPZ9_9ALTE
MITQAEYDQRRARLIAECLPNSVVVLPAAQMCTRSNDTEYHFRQNSDFWYFTGFNEPDAYLILSNRDNANSFASYVFLRPKDKTAEIWHGRRLGVQSAPSTLNIQQAYSIEELDELLPTIINGHDHLYYTAGANTLADKVVNAAIKVCKTAPKQAMSAPKCVHDISIMIHKMRLIKSEQEIAVMQRAADISAQAHCKAMQIAHPDIWEYQLEADILHTFASNGARFAAYNTIVGGGENACILHYVDNNQRVADGDLVLIDAGCELHGYAADITRTFPINGKFTPAQAEIYQLVLDAQLASLDLLKPSGQISVAMDRAVEIITKGLIRLGIIKQDFESAIESQSWRNFFMHGLGHYLGLDVHDVGVYKVNGADIPLTPGIVMTVEPGIYISPDADVPEQYKGIGIRIEDNILITEGGNKILTDKVPKTIKDIETLMLQNAL